MHLVLDLEIDTLSPAVFYTGQPSRVSISRLRLTCRLPVDSLVGIAGAASIVGRFSRVVTGTHPAELGQRRPHRSGRGRR